MRVFKSIPKLVLRIKYNGIVPFILMFFIVLMPCVWAISNDYINVLCFFVFALWCRLSYENTSLFFFARKKLPFSRYRVINMKMITSLQFTTKCLPVEFAKDLKRLLNSLDEDTIYTATTNSTIRAHIHKECDVLKEYELGETDIPESKHLVSKGCKACQKSFCPLKIPKEDVRLYAIMFRKKKANGS